MRIQFIYVALFGFLTSCSDFRQKNDSNIMAQVFDNYLYRSDIKGITPAGISASDSTYLVDNYIESWVKQMLMLGKAEENLDADKKDVELQLRNYRNSLLIYAYQKELVETKLDTIVSDAEIEKHYIENRRNFVLKDNIVSVIYVKVDGNINVKELKKVREWCRSDNKRDRRSLETFCKLHAINYYLDEENWLLFDDLLKEIPIKTYNKELFLMNNRYVEIEDQSGLYIVNIKGFKTKESLSPITFEKENIRNMVINKRKIKLIKTIEEEIYKEALANNFIKIYGKENNN